ncbi:site-specific recombinase [Jeotgalibacillus campisalis]|uniref:Site-specific recombinase n=1 Tax=Jeotgalibacillus campisalis TaxID=220754 RepID=A0A0C2R9Q9_9BACL|nr:site-specific recombinase [Jeotgalibacillus campisalis]
MQSLIVNEEDIESTKDFAILGFIAMSYSINFNTLNFVMKDEMRDYAVDLGTKLKEFLFLKDLTPQLLHTLVEKVTCNKDNEIRIHYNFLSV